MESRRFRQKGRRGKAYLVEAQSKPASPDLILDSFHFVIVSSRIAASAGRLQGRPMQNVDALIAVLNTIEVGEIDSIRSQLLDVREELGRRDLVDLVTKLDESLAALAVGDLKNFRRLKESIVSRLGHLR
jgi:hypothetical protein